MLIGQFLICIYHGARLSARPKNGDFYFDKPRIAVLFLFVVIGCGMFFFIPCSDLLVGVL